MLKVDKQVVQRFSHRTFWHQENARASSQKVLLANATKRYWGLYQGLQRLVAFQDSLSYVLRRSSIVVYFNSLIEKPVKRLCDRLLNHN